MYKNILNSVIRRAKKDFYINYYDQYKQDAYKTWKGIRALQSEKRSVSIKSLVVGGAEVSSESDVADELNRYFVSVAEDLNRNLPPTSDSVSIHLGNRLSNSFYFYPVCENEVLKIIHQMKCSNNPSDIIPIKILKECSTILAGTIAELVNFSMSSGVFPNSLKVARVTPLFKGGDSRSASCYRPIFVLPAFSKIFERCIYSRIYQFFH